MQAIRAETKQCPEPRILSINLVKRPCVPETAVPHLVDRLDCIHIILTLRSAHHRLHRPPPHTILMLIRKFEDLIPEELIRPSAFSA